MMMKMKRLFTLIEVMIAVSIMLIITITLFSYSRETTRTWGKLIGERNKFNELLTFDRTIHQIFTHAVPFYWKNSDAENVTFIIAESNRLRCAYLHSLNDAEEGALRFVELYIDDQNLVMKYTDRPFLEWEDVENRAHATVLLQGVSEIKFSYADWTDETDDDWDQRLMWTDNWETETSERMDIPLAIMLHVVWIDGREECWLRRTMGNSYRERLGNWDPLSEEKRNGSE